MLEAVESRFSASHELVGRSIAEVVPVDIPSDVFRLLEEPTASGNNFVPSAVAREDARRFEGTVLLVEFVAEVD